MTNIIEEQYQLSKYVGISITESGELPDHERIAYLSLLVRDKKEELEALNSS